MPTTARLFKELPSLARTALRASHVLGVASNKYLSSAKNRSWPREWPASETIEHAAHISTPAKLVKLADKISPGCPCINAVMPAGSIIQSGGAAPINACDVVRSTITGNRIARVLFSITGSRMVILHGFVKKTQKTPSADLTLARKRMKEIEQ